MPALDPWLGLDPIHPALLHLPTPDSPLPLHRAWTADGASVWTDAAGRRWWPFTSTVPQYCAWCDACLTRGWACKSVGVVCRFHIRQAHPTESEGTDDHSDRPGIDGPDGGGAAGGGGGTDPPRPLVRCPECGTPLLPNGECPYKLFWHTGEWDHAHIVPPPPPVDLTGGPDV